MYTSSAKKMEDTLNKHRSTTRSVEPEFGVVFYTLYSIQVRTFVHILST